MIGIQNRRNRRHVPILYHGTDARIVRMSPSEIKAFKQDILRALDYMWVFFEPYTVKHTHIEYNQISKRHSVVRDAEYLMKPLDYDKDSTLYSQVILAISINQHRLNGRKQWQYDGLYLTNWDWQAWGYAKRAYAFGELGMIAQALIKGARKINFKGWNPDADTERAMNRIIAFSNDKAEPIVIVLNNLNIEHIKDEGGEGLKEGTMYRVFMYDGEINLNDYPFLDAAPTGKSRTEMFEFKNGALSMKKWWKALIHNLLRKWKQYLEYQFPQRWWTWSR